MKKLLRSVPGEISTKEPYVVVLPDSIEHDLTFTFHMREDKSRQDSYTNFHVLSPTAAEISIYNAPEKKRTFIIDDIHVGSYMKQYELFVNYILQRDSKERGSITVNFYTEEK